MVSYEKTLADADMERRIDEAASSPDSFNHLARSIAPEIYGTSDLHLLRSTDRLPWHACQCLPLAD